MSHRFEGAPRRDRTRTARGRALAQWRRLALLACALLMVATRGEASEELVVTYPLVNNLAQREVDRYYLTLLELALDKAGVPYRLQAAPTPMISESISGPSWRCGAK